MRKIPFYLLIVAPLVSAQALEIRFTTPPQGEGKVASEVNFSDAAKFPSSNWESQAQPLGNGRLGAMVFGNPLRERIQFNESSLWTGGANPSGGYDMNDFGAYQNFGDMNITLGTADEFPDSIPSCVSGHKSFTGSEDVPAASDGMANTKWCVETDGKDVVWQIDLNKQQVVTGYSFTSANDAPERDPRTWKLEGSDDLIKWIPYDNIDAAAPFTQRGETKSFTPAGKAPSRYYRFVFTPAAGVSHFQVAEIKLDGVDPGIAGVPLTDFSRTLSLSTASHLTTWKKGGVTFKREVIVSKPDEVIAVKISADKPGMIIGNVTMTGGHKETSAAAGDELGFSGELSNGLRQAARLKVISQGGKAVSADDKVHFTGDSVTIYLAAATDYVMDPAKQFRSGVDPADTVKAQLASVATKEFDAVRVAHVEDFQKLMGRVELDIGAAPEGKAITERLDAYKNGAQDTHLEALMFQYGRYLLISSSRGFLPANLQGLWNDNNSPAWHSDYHTNINLQMCYWLAEPANLSECAEPLLKWTTAMIPGSREATSKAFGAETLGWTMRTSVNIFGGNGWDWNIPASAWLAQHFMEHYAFTGDKKFLRDDAWPIFKEVSLFSLGHLVEKDGKLLVPDGWSPEHGPREDGVAHDQQVMWDLFTNTLKAAEILGIDDEFVAKVAVARGRLLGPQIGSWGQLMEWTTERPDLEKSQHRHTSHLFAVFPGNQINLSQTPEWAKAAAISLDARGSDGDSRRSWTWPWRTAMWARLGRPDRAGEMIRGLLTFNTMPNLFTSHPPFQLDGNLGITAGICETLLQSHAGEVSVLPAVPPSWKSGSYRGLIARGGFEVDAAWSDGTLNRLEVKSKLGEPLALRLPGSLDRITVQQVGGRKADIKADPTSGLFLFPTTADATYLVKLSEPAATSQNTAVIPVPKLENDSYDWVKRHEEVLSIKAGINPEIVLIGDSITHFWGGEPKANHVNGPKAWDSVFGKSRVLNLGFGWDRTQNVLWRMAHGELDETKPRLVVINIGTNNTSGTPNARQNTAAEIAEGVSAVCSSVQEKVPSAKIVLMAIFPREEKADDARRKLIGETNQLLAKIAKDKGIVFLDIGPQLLSSDGTLGRDMMPDFCHPSEKAYQVWADALRPFVTNLPNP